MKVDLKKDLSTLTTIDELSIGRMFDKINWCISDDVEKAMILHDNQVEVDLGFGTLTLHLAEDSVRYKFIPSPTLEKSIVNTIVNGSNELELVLEKTLVSKMTNIYKDMF